MSAYSGSAARPRPHRPMDAAPRAAVGDERYPMQNGSAFTDAAEALDFRALFEGHPHAVLALGRDGRVTAANEACRRIWRAPPADLVDSPFLSLIMPEDRDRAEAALAAARDRESEPVRLGVACRDGARVDADVTLTPAAGGAAFVVAVAAGEGAAAGDELFRRILDESAEMFVYVQDPAGLLEYVSPGSARVLGYAPAELVGTRLDRLAEPQQDGGTADALAGTRAGVYRHRNGSLRHLDLLEAPIQRGGRITGMQGLARDVTRQRQLQEQLLHDALHDPLTGLPNRALFMDRLLHTARASGRSPGATYALLLVDVDDFKRINDRLGHELGDRVLVDMAARLERCVRPGDTVCRLGGDEFTVLLHSISEAGDATRVADRIRAELIPPFRYPPNELFVTTSIGIAVSSTSGDEPRELLRHADTALYRAKSNGKARYEVFDREMHESTLERLQLEADLRGAVRGGALSLLYQPVVSLRTGRISAFEALVRWRHPSRGTLSADQFVPVAEDTGLVGAIDRWVLREACRQLQVWSRQFGDRSPHVSVNVSARELLSPDNVENLRRIIAETGADASLLRLEVPESVLADPRIEAVLRDLRTLGVVVQVDHFGTVGSPVGSLRKLAVEGLKVHRSVLHQPADPEVLRAIVSLAHALRLSVVAGGVETDEQMTTLRGMECDFAQGYLFSAPVDADEARRMMARDLPV